MSDQPVPPGKPDPVALAAADVVALVRPAVPDRRPAAKPAVAAGTDFWVFGYGSLMWAPGFAFVEQRLALLRGYHRKFCILSHRWRGTPERPGLVLGLDRGGSCRGIAFRVPAADVDATLDYLWEREMANGVYIPRLLPVRWRGGRVDACAFVVDRSHDQYAGGIAVQDAIRMIRQGCGQAGPNRDYLANTVRHLHDLGIPDPPLDQLLAAVEAGPS